MAGARITAAALLAGLAVVAACGAEGRTAARAAPTTTPNPAPVSAPLTAPAVADAPTTSAPPRPTTTSRPAPTPTTSLPPPAAAARTRVSRLSGWKPFASVGGVTLTHPAARVERVGFHESSHDGARQLEAAATAVAPVTVESRGRGTGARTAADVVVEPGTEIRSPVTGRVKRAGRYVLYCKHSDDYVVVEPDGHPGWEVKILHINGERVSPGDRVVAGQTVIAPRATELPFASQVDELRTADPAWPHTHIEVVDPSIPDRRSPGGGCS